MPINVVHSLCLSWKKLKINQSCLWKAVGSLRERKCMHTKYNHKVNCPRIFSQMKQNYGLPLDFKWWVQDTAKGPWLQENIQHSSDHVPGSPFPVLEPCPYSSATHQKSLTTQVRNLEDELDPSHKRQDGLETRGAWGRQPVPPGASLERGSKTARGSGCGEKMTTPSILQWRIRNIHSKICSKSNLKSQ